MKLFKRPIKKPKPLQTKQIAFSYSNQEILRDISLQVKPGEIISIIGKSGCGKSTFLKIIAGIITTTYTGKIKIFGKNRILNKNKIGFTPQEISFIPDISILDNIKIFALNTGIKETKGITQAKKLMEMLRLEEDINKLPNQLSGGQQVRLNIILSLLHNPDIIILDEPFNGLDFKNRRLLWHFLETMQKQKKSIILTSHLLSETQEHATRLIILKNGKIFFSGNIESLKTKLKISHIYEIRFAHLSNHNLNEIKKYCTYKDLKILDNYNKYMMFAISSETQKTTLTKFLQKLNLNYQEISLREPNLDEVFLKA
jgi:ABC-type multidrug transport system ATPase subunit